MADRRGSAQRAVTDTGPIEAGVRRAIAAASVGAVMLTAVSLIVEPLRSLPAAEHVQLGLETPGALVAAAAAAVLAARCVQTHVHADGLAALALGIVSATSLVFAIGPMIGGAPGRGPASLAMLVGWLVAAAMLAAGGSADARRLPSFLGTPARLVAPGAAALGALTLLGWWLWPAAATALDRASRAGAIDGARPLARAIEVATGVLFLVAAGGLARRAERDQDRPAAWLAVAAVLGAWLSADHVLFPWLQSDFAFHGDLVRVAFYAVLGVTVASGVADRRRRAARAAVLDERRRLARELHDGLAQDLAYIATHAATLDHRPAADVAGARLAKAAERALEESRAAIAALTLPCDGSLRSVLRRAATPPADAGGATLTVAVPDGLEVEPEVAEALSRIVREATGNAVRHGHATHVAVDMDDRTGLRLRIADDGCGFEPAAVGDQDAFGLISMRERAEALGAAFRVESTAGAGTRIEVAW